MSIRLRFSTRPDGVIDVDPGGQECFSDAFADAITTSAPHDSGDTTPCTYWIDQALEAVERTPREPGKPFMSGHHTDLTRDGDDVIATSYYGYEARQLMPVSEFVEVLQAWRAHVLAAREQGAPRTTGVTPAVDGA